MTKLGIVPVPGAEEAANEKKVEDLQSVKVDPKVFTVLQPVYPPPAAIPVKQYSPFASLCRVLIYTLLFVTVTAVTLYLAHGIYRREYILKQQSDLVDQLQKNQRQSFNAEKLIRANSNLNQLHPAQQLVDGAVNRKPAEMVAAEQNEPIYNNWDRVNAHNMEYVQNQRMLRYRRLQQLAMMEQQEQMARAAWAQQMEARAQWEAARMARAQWEASQMARAQWENARQVRAQWAQYLAAQHQQQQMQPNFVQPQFNAWHQQIRADNEARMEALHAAQREQYAQWVQQQQQMENQQRAWAPNFQPANVQQQQPQVAEQQQFPEQQIRPLMIVRTFSRMLPTNQENNIPTRPHDASPQEIINNMSDLPQPAIHDRIYQEMQKKSQGMDFNAPSRPIWTAITPTPETPQVNADQIFEENMKKAMELEKATTPVPTLPTVDSSSEEKNDDNIFRDIFNAMAVVVQQETQKANQNNIFQEVNELQKQQESDEEQKSKENIFQTVERLQKEQEANEEEKKEENIFQEVDRVSEHSKKQDVAEEPKQENIFQEVSRISTDLDKEEKNEDNKPEKEESKTGTNIFEQITQMADAIMPKVEDNDKPLPDDEDVFQVVENAPSAPRSEQKVEETTEPVVIEDSFPRIDERTTTSEAPIEDESAERDPLAGFVNMEEFEKEALEVVKALRSNNQQEKEQSNPSVQKPSA
ncbi:unnamed protein product [Auanema sp. JU1783]|nr:unnamed protein product [Auanema sp. JU1783]